MYECERDITNLAILNFSATIDLLEKIRERSSAEFLEGDELCSQIFFRKIKHDKEIQIIGFVIDRIVSHALKKNDSVYVFNSPKKFIHLSQKTAILDWKGSKMEFRPRHLLVTLM